MSFISKDFLIHCKWYEFERTIFRLLQHQGYRDLLFTPKTNDRGADIIAMPPASDDFIIFQCKQSANAAVGRGGVDDLVRACDFYDISKGILVTNTNLSGPAKQRMKELNQQYSFEYFDFDRLVGISSQLAAQSKIKKELRPYQEEASAAVIESFNEGITRNSVIFATGLGKTLILAELCIEYAEHRDEPTLLLTHSKPLAEQLEVSLWSQLGLDTETRLWHSDTRRPRNFNGVTVALYHSVINALEQNVELPNFGIVLVDECHHALAPEFQKTLNLLNFDRLFGTTATPWRGDEKRIEDIFGEPICTMGIVEGIHRGYLADVDYTMLVDNVDWNNVADNTEQQLTIKDLNARLFLHSRDEEMCVKIIEEWRRYDQPPTITFCRSIKHAESLARLLTSMGMPSRAIHSREELISKEECIKRLMDFRNKKFVNLISIDMLNEGIDVPDVGMVIFARVTHSRRIFVQQLGRGLRITDEKKRVRVLDFVADIRRISEGYQLNRESAIEQNIETYSGTGAQLIEFQFYNQANFVDEFLRDIADLDENERINLNFLMEN